jgi:hypothetical protein
MAKTLALGKSMNVMAINLDLCPWYKKAYKVGHPIPNDGMKSGGIDAVIIPQGFLVIRNDADGSSEPEFRNRLF